MPGEGLQQQLEAELSRNAVLVAALSSAKAERDAAQLEAASARQRAQQTAGQLLQLMHARAPSAGTCCRKPTTKILAVAPCRATPTPKPCRL
jgi:hypothetical protein